MSAKKMETTSCVPLKFIVFMKGTLGKMVATKTLDPDFINLQFWQNWPRKFYNVKSYDNTKDDFEKETAKAHATGFTSDSDDSDDHTCSPSREDAPDLNVNIF